MAFVAPFVEAAAYEAGELIFAAGGEEVFTFGSTRAAAAASRTRLFQAVGAAIAGTAGTAAGVAIGSDLRSSIKRARLENGSSSHASVSAVPGSGNAIIPLTGSVHRMPYKRKYSRRPKKSFGRKRVSKSTKAYVSRTMARQVETKSIDGQVTSVAFDRSGVQLFGTGATSMVNAPPQGTGQGQRTGNKIKELFLEVKGEFEPLTGGQTECVRIIIYRDNDNKGSAPALTDMVENGAALNDYGIQFKKYDSRKRFTWLLDACVPINGTGVAGASVVVPFHYRIPLRKQLVFNQAGTAWGSLDSGGIGGFVIASIAGPQKPLMRMAWRFLYKDV